MDTNCILPLCCIVKCIIPSLKLVFFITQMIGLPLTIAAGYGREEIVSLLLEAGVNIDQQNKVIAIVHFYISIN